MSDAFQFQPCADITPVPIGWLWEPYLARGKLAILDGDHGTGKSLLTTDLAARLSRGGPLPNGQQLDEPVTTLLLNAEEDPAITARPQFEAAGADLSRVVVASLGPYGPPQLPDCVPELKRAIEESGAQLLVLDPLSAFIPYGWATSDHRMRQALVPLSAAAAETGCAVLLVRCIGKNVGANAVYRGGGSAGALSLALTGLLLAPHPEEPGVSVLALTKTHLGQRPLGLGLRFRAGASLVLDWTGAVDLNANELCVPQSGDLVRRPRERAADFLRTALANGPRPVEELQQLAAEHGVSWRMMERVKQEVNVISERGRGKSGWIWRLPSQEAYSHQATRVAVLGELLAMSTADGSKDPPDPNAANRPPR